MVGKSSSTRLRSLGITTIGELAHTDKDFLMREFKSHGLLMWEYANGIAPAEVHSTVEKLKGVGNSTTLAQDVSNADDAKKVLLALAEQVSSRLRKSNQLAQSVTVEIKYSTFQRTLHQKVLLFPRIRPSRSMSSPAVSLMSFGTTLRYGCSVSAPENF